jgi:putative ABC transport system permease protein
MDTFWQDIRYAFRMLLKNRGVTLVAILALALGIGANSAIFSVVNAVLLRPLPYEEPKRLVFLSEWSQQVPNMSISMANFNDWRTTNTVFESIVAFRTQNAVLTGQGEPERVQVRQMTAGLFPTLRIKPILGRAMTPEEDKVGAERVVLLSEGFWARRFGRDPNILNKLLTLNGESYTVIGVLPTAGLHSTWRQFDLFSSLWRFEDRDGGPQNRGNHPGIYAFARMKPGVTVEKARAEMRDIAKRLEQQYPNSNTGDSVTVLPLLDAIVGEDLPTELGVLLCAVGFVLLIACANVANLLLARAAERQKEMAVRAALGASRGRLVRQLLTESVLLAIVGGALGLLLAGWAGDALVTAAPANIPRIQEVSMDRGVLAFTLCVSIFTGLFFGMFPALHISRTDLHETLKEGGRGGSAGLGRQRMRSALVVGEVAISIVLLVGAGLMLKSLYNVLHADGGIDSRGVLTASLTLPEAEFKDDTQRRQFIQQLVEKLKAIPGVEAAGFKLPLLGGWQTAFIIEGRPIPQPGQFLSTDYGRITPDTLRAMGIRLLRGRYFTDQDNENAPLVCIIDETMASSQWPAEDPLGKRIALGGLPPAGQPTKWITVVGVARHVKHYGVDQPSRVELYIPAAQRSSTGGWLVLRTARDPASLAPAMREAVKSINPNVPLFAVRPMEEIVSDSTAPRRLSVLLLGAFAALALVLAAIGIYGVMSYFVIQRSHEIGIRMALGAQREDILRLVVRQGLGLAALGLAIGLGASLYLSRFLTTQLFGVQTKDAGTYATIPLLLALVALAACYIPARRATKVDPMLALRYE